MKNLIIIITVVLLYACDPYYVTTFFLKNSTNDSIRIEFYRNGSVSSEKTIYPISSIVLLHDSGISGAPTKISFELDDSIRVLKNDKFIIYYRDNTLKSGLYKIENWIEKRVGKRNYEYTFEFTEDSFN